MKYVIEVVWGSNRVRFKDIEELKANYKTLNNRPIHCTKIIDYSKIRKSQKTAQEVNKIEK